MFCFPDTKSFESQFAQRRDSGFYTFREFHTFIRKLAGRALLPRHVPDILDWKSLGDLQGQNWRQLSNRDFLSRLKLKENLDAACHARVRRIYSEKQLTPEETETAAEAIRDDFATKARGYLVHLLKVFLADISLNAGMVRGLGSFDPVALLSLPLEQATSKKPRPKKGGNNVSCPLVKARKLAFGQLVKLKPQSPVMRTLLELLNLKCTKSTFVSRLYLL